MTVSYNYIHVYYAFSAGDITLRNLIVKDNAFVSILLLYITFLAKVGVVSSTKLIVTF